MKSIEPPTDQELEAAPICADALEAWALANLPADGIEAATYFIDHMLTQYPRSTADVPSVTRDEILYELGIAYVYYGDRDRAVELMNQIGAAQEGAGSGLKFLASRFLGTLQSGGTILDACIEVKDCSGSLSVQQMTGMIPVSRFPQVISLLGDLGVDTQYSGHYDFDHDGKTEAWFVEQHPGWAYGSLWILARDQSRIVARNAVGVRLDSLSPTSRIVPFGAQSGFFEYELTLPGSEPTQESFFYWNATLKPRVIRYQQPQSAAVNSLLTGLLTGASSPTDTLLQLSDLRKILEPCLLWEVETYGCETTNRLDYVEALAYELAGQRIKAEAAYWQLWQKDPDDGYGIMARAKLQPSR